MPNALVTVFPNASPEALAAVLEFSAGDETAALDFLLSNEGALREVEDGIRSSRAAFVRGWRWGC